LVIKQLHYLVALARERHFGRAAAAVNISQPTLSAAIRQLEDELGVPVVERGHRFNGLTPEGEFVLAHAKRILAEADTLRQGLSELRQGLSGRLRIGVIPTGLPLVAQLTAPFHARYPAVTVHIRSHTSKDIQRGIDNFDLDVGITYLDNEPLDRVISKPVYQESYVLLTRADGQLRDCRELSWTEAASLNLCLLTPDNQNRRIIDGIFRSIGQTPRVTVETNSIFSLCAHAAVSGWASIVPTQLVQFYGAPHDTRAIRLVDPEPVRTVGIIVADRDPLPPLARSMFGLATRLETIRMS